MSPLKVGASRPFKQHGLQDLLSLTICFSLLKIFDLRLYRHLVDGLVVSAMGHVNSVDVSKTILACWNIDDSRNTVKHFHFCVVWTHLNNTRISNSLFPSLLLATQCLAFVTSIAMYFGQHRFFYGRRREHIHLGSGLLPLWKFTPMEII